MTAFDRMAAPSLSMIAPEPMTFPEEVVVDKIADLFLADKDLWRLMDLFARKLVGADDVKERLIFLRADAEARAPDALQDEWAQDAGC